MFRIAALLSLISQVSGTPYIPGGDSPAGTDCSGLASWVANVASGRPAFGSRFNTGNMESALLARGFHYGSAPDSVVIGWNGGHAAVTLPDGTPVSSGESNHGVAVGGGGAYQPQFSHHMYLPVEAQEKIDTVPQAGDTGGVELTAAAPPPPDGVLGAVEAPVPADGVAPAPEAAPAPEGGPVPADAQVPAEVAVPVEAAVPAELPAIDAPVDAALPADVVPA
jgi:hypothetical protein